MTDVRERRISHTELTLTTFACLACKAELTLDFANEKQRQAALASDPLACPFCGQSFDRWLREALRAFQEMREKLAAAKCAVVFRVPENRQ